MEREIKFRAWDNAEKKWLLGYEYPNLGGFCMTGEVMLFEQWSEVINRFILQQRDRKPEDLILMQFTGLFDSQRKEIYEGDILHNQMNERLFDWLIDFHNGGFKLRNIGVDGFLDEHRPLYHAICRERTVIGNKYENPELLKTAKRL